MKQLGFSLYALTFFLISACASGTGEHIAYKKVEKSIVRGETSQNDVIRIMGSPNLVTKNSRGEQVWTYTKKTYNPETGDVANGIILSGGSKPSAQGSNTAAFDLILTFDQNEVVRDYNVVSTEL